MIKKQKLMVCNNIKNIDLKKNEITFSLNYAPYLKSAQERGENLLKLLMDQIIDYWSKIPIRGLSLTWTEYSDEDLK
ncbi:MAG: hypothetical protein ACFFG0_50615 [Candidatus Thorarchaeota archaeon]